MNDRLSEILELSLQAIEKGAPVEECLRAYPKQAKMLRPLLEAALAARELALPGVPENSVTRVRARVLSRAAKLRAAARSPRSIAVPWRLAGAMLALLAFLVIGASGIVSASAQALPGDTLYPVKRAVEDIRLQLAANPEAETKIRQEISASRIHETEELLAIQRIETVEFEGRISEVLPDGWVIAGIEVHITADTEIQGLPAVGRYAEVHGQTQLTNSVLATQIVIQQEDNDEILLPSPTPPQELPSSSPTPESDSQSDEDEEKPESPTVTATPPPPEEKSPTPDATPSPSEESEEEQDNDND